MEKILILPLEKGEIFKENQQLIGTMENCLKCLISKLFFNCLWLIEKIWFNIESQSTKFFPHFFQVSTEAFL